MWAAVGYRQHFVLCRRPLQIIGTACGTCCRCLQPVSCHTCYSCTTKILKQHVSQHKHNSSKLHIHKIPNMNEIGQQTAHANPRYSMLRLSPANCALLLYPATLAILFHQFAYTMSANHNSTKLNININKIPTHHARLPLPFHLLL